MNTIITVKHQLTERWTAGSPGTPLATVAGLGSLARLAGQGLAAVGEVRLTPAVLGLLGVVPNIESLESLGPEHIGINDRSD